MGKYGKPHLLLLYKGHIPSRGSKYCVIRVTTPCVTKYSKIYFSLDPEEPISSAKNC